jgi:hypothetical protein
MCGTGVRPRPDHWRRWPGLAECGNPLQCCPAGHGQWPINQPKGWGRGRMVVSILCDGPTTSMHADILRQATHTLTHWHSHTLTYTLRPSHALTRTARTARTRSRTRLRTDGTDTAKTKLQQHQRGGSEHYSHHPPVAGSWIVTKLTRTKTAPRMRQCRSCIAQTRCVGRDSRVLHGVWASRRPMAPRQACTAASMSLAPRSSLHPQTEENTYGCKPG